MKSNEQIADHLQQIAYLFLKDKDQWRSRAFSNVAGIVRTTAKPLEFDKGILTSKVQGAGDSIKEVIEAFVATGTSKKLDMLKAKLPNEVVERFDAKTAKRKVSKLLAPLTTAGIDWGYAGSLRRGLRTVKDVDVVVVLNGKDEKALCRKLIEADGLKVDIREGDTKWGISIPVKAAARSFALDLNFCPPESKGAYYLYFTGSKALNIDMRGLAKRKGLLLNEKGVFKGDKCIASKTEEEMFKALGLKYLKPEQREGGLKRK